MECLLISFCTTSFFQHHPGYSTYELVGGRGLDGMEEGCTLRSLNSVREPHPWPLGFLLAPGQEVQALDSSFLTGWMASFSHLHPTGTASPFASSTAAPALWPGLPSSPSWASCLRSRACPYLRLLNQVSDPGKSRTAALLATRIQG